MFALFLALFPHFHPLPSKWFPSQDGLKDISEEKSLKSEDGCAFSLKALTPRPLLPQVIRLLWMEYLYVTSLGLQLEEASFL